MVTGMCIKCGKEKDISADGVSKGLCHVCYKKYLWKPKLKSCLRCNREKPIHAKGFCVGCYNSIFHIEKVRLQNAKKRYGINGDLYKQVTSKCMSCGFDKIVDMHHLDHNRQNSSPNNLVGLCPNCHKMVHSKKYQKEIFNSLEKQGFTIPRGYELDGFFRK